MHAEPKLPFFAFRSSIRRSNSSMTAPSPAVDQKDKSCCFRLKSSNSTIQCLMEGVHLIGSKYEAPTPVCLFLWGLKYGLLAFIWPIISMYEFQIQDPCNTGPWLGSFLPVKLVPVWALY